MATMARRFLLPRGWLGTVRLLACPWLGRQHLSRLLAAGSEEHLPEALDGGVAILQQMGQIGERLQRRFKLEIVLGSQRCLAGALQPSLEFLQVQFQRLEGWLHRTSASRWRKTWTRGNTHTCLIGRLGLLLGAAFPRPVVWPTRIQLAAREQGPRNRSGSTKASSTETACP